MQNMTCGRFRKLIGNRYQNGSKKEPKSNPKTIGSRIWEILERFGGMLFFDDFLDRKKITQHSEKSNTSGPEGATNPQNGSARRNALGHRGGKEGLKPLQVWQGS